MLKRVLAAALAVACLARLTDAQADPAPPTPSYILNGFRLSGVNGVDEDALVATLKHKEGDRITRADIAADSKTLSEALKARHIEGQLSATMAEKHGRVWVLFDFAYKQAQETPIHQGRWLGSQFFDGNVEISSEALTAAAGLKHGDDLPPERINAARQAILDAYKKAAPGEDVHIRLRMRSTPQGQAELTWLIAEPK